MVNDFILNTFSQDEEKCRLSWATAIQLNQYLKAVKQIWLSCLFFFLSLGPDRSSDVSQTRFVDALVTPYVALFPLVFHEILVSD